MMNTSSNLVDCTHDAPNEPKLDCRIEKSDIADRFYHALFFSRMVTKRFVSA
jgi:hypothetical protein